MSSTAPVTISAELAQEIWTEIKDARDLAYMRERDAARLNDLLGKMKAAGLDAWIPTLEEVQAAGPYYNASKSDN